MPDELVFTRILQAFSASRSNHLESQGFPNVVPARAPYLLCSLAVRRFDSLDELRADVFEDALSQPRAEGTKEEGPSRPKPGFG